MQSVKELQRALREQHGSLLRGWRNALDPDGDLTCSFTELCKAASRINFTGDVAELFHDKTVLHLRDVDESIADVLERMRNWIRDVFGSLEVLFNRFDVSGDGQLCLDEFSEACLKHGFSASESQLEEIFHGLDLDRTGFITKDDVLILVQDPDERHAMMGELVQKKDTERRRLVQELHAQLRLTSHTIGPMHRLADRPWHEDIAELPEIVKQKRAKRLQQATQKKVEALALFQQHLKSTYGHEVRAWRRALCPGDGKDMDRKQFMAYCRQVEFEGDSSSLWEALDRDNEGSISMEEVAPKYARILADFRQWASSKTGRCVKLWRTEAFRAGERKSGSVRKMYGRDFAAAITSLGYDAQPRDLRLLSSGLDIDGVGFVRVEDLMWLDGWNPPAWILAKPDRRALQKFLVLLLEIFGSFTQAWRNLLDKDGSNRVSWLEFKTACHFLQFENNIEGIWRALDEDCSGWISLKQIDRGTHDMLDSFKHWAEKYFGSVALAFKSLDKDNSGELTFSELRNACSHLNWGGNPRVLFDSLDNPASGQRRSIELSEIAFLDQYNEMGKYDEEKARLALLKSKSKLRTTSPTFYCTRTLAELETMRGCSNSKTMVDVEHLFRRRPHSAVHGRQQGSRALQRPKTASSIRQ